MSYTTDKLEYTATGGETTYTNALLVGASIVKLTRGVVPQIDSQYTFDSQSGQIDFTDSLIQGENIFIIYTTENQ